MRKPILILLILLFSCQKDFYLEDLRKAESQISSLNSKIQDLEKSQEELLERISNLLNEKASLLENNQELSNQISQLQEDLTNSSISLEEALELLNQYEEQINELEKEKDELLDSIQSLLSEKASLLENNQELSNQISQLQEDLTNSSISLEEALELLNQYEQEIIRLENYSPIEYEEIDTFLSTPASDAVRQVNVVVLNYIPTKDKGKTLDQYTFPFRSDDGSYDPNLPVSEYKKWILGETIRVKAGIEEGSKFRGYNNSSAKPSVGIKVIRYINVYEMPKVERQLSQSRFAVDSTEAYYPDYHKLFQDLDMENLVNTHDVKEIWFNRKSLSVPESNMSSPSSGDVSNGYYEQGYTWNPEYENNDLPVYGKTYVVYSHWLHNTYDFTLHVRGHQIERQFSATDGNDFIFGKYKGQVNSDLGRTRGCGTVHFPPNATSDYQYNNSHYIQSDIEDWKPDGTGEQTLVNNSNWIREYNINYSFPTSTYKGETQRSTIGNDPQGGWMIYWFQSIPGYNNGIQYNGKDLKNFWDVFYDWDYHYTNDRDLLN